MSGLWMALRPAARGIAASSVWKTAAVTVAPAALSATMVRKYAASHGLSREDVEGRVLEVLKSFDKVDESKVSQSIASVACPHGV